jgi:hypothetical protein
MATIAYEVSCGTMPKDRIDKFKKYFTRIVFTELENNCLRVCNPSFDNNDGNFRKLNYKLPKQCQKFCKETTWVKILENVSLDNIHLHCDSSQGKQSLTQKNEGFSAADLFGND